MGDVMVIDGDGHLMEPPDMWSARMDAKKWGDSIPHFDAEGTFWIGGVARIGGPGMHEEVARINGVTVEELFESYARTTSSTDTAGGHDPQARLRSMDADGIDVAVMYPTKSLQFGPSDPIPAIRDNPEFVLACHRAYNDWASEYCTTAPDRLFAIAAVPLQDIALAVAEAERAVNTLGLKGVAIRPSATQFSDAGDDLPFSNRVYDPFWAACQDLDIPVGLHPIVHVDTPGACRKFGLVRDSPSLNMTNSAVDENHGGSAMGQAIGNPVDMIVSMGRLLMGDVCERFPRLRFIFLESGGGWCATQLERMDEQLEAFPLEGRRLSMMPSEYFRRQCYVSFDPGEWNLAASAEFIGADRIIWASDYPHPEYTPEVVPKLKAAISTLPADSQRKILGANAADAYRLPVGRTASVAR
ncbi:MAG: amidohydrolase [Acidimicrobiia bacterium]|nr:amidohydrolase [Acidimicrobiia bacterium]